MNSEVLKYFAAFAFALLFAVSSPAQKSVSVKDFYPLRDGNVWNYTVPPDAKLLNYVSRVFKDENEFTELYRNRKSETEPEFPITLASPKNKKGFRHYDATGAAKLLLVKKDGVYYVGEEFADMQSFVRFYDHVSFFPFNVKIGAETVQETKFRRFYNDGRIVIGTFKLTQKAVGFEDVKTAAGEFKHALRIDSQTFWDMGDGTKARTENVYHYAKRVGVVKASARFVIINAEGKEIINRLVETDLKSYKVKN